MQNYRTPPKSAQKIIIRKSHQEKFFCFNGAAAKKIKLMYINKIIDLMHIQKSARY